MCWELGTGQGMLLLSPAHLHSLRMPGHLWPSPQPLAILTGNNSCCHGFLWPLWPCQPVACMDAARQNAACPVLLPCPQDGCWDPVRKPSCPRCQHRDEAPKYQSFLTVQNTWCDIFKHCPCCALTGAGFHMVSERVEGRGPIEQFWKSFL